MEEFYLWTLGLSNSQINLNILNYSQTKTMNKNILKKLIMKLNIYSSIDNGEYDEKIEKLKKQKYYLEKNKKDYIYYYINHKETMEKDIISIVNTGFFKEDILIDSNEEIILVNKHYHLYQDYVPDNLINNSKIKLNKEAYLYFKEMRNAALKVGIKLSIISGYRTFLEQKAIFKNNLANHSEYWVEMNVARAGTSEHQTGLAIDIDTSTKSDNLNKGIEWLKIHSYEYGYILRYPENKEKITGYYYEPWHYRYVGKAVAKEIYDKKITLDEYYAYYIENTE